MAYYMLPRLKRLEHGDSALVRVLKRGNAALLELRVSPSARADQPSLSTAVTMAGIAASLLPRAFLPPFNEGTLHDQHAVQSRASRSRNPIVSA